MYLSKPLQQRSTTAAPATAAACDRKTLLCLSQLQRKAARDAFRKMVLDFEACTDTFCQDFRLSTLTEKLLKIKEEETQVKGSIKSEFQQLQSEISEAAAKRKQLADLHAEAETLRVSIAGKQQIGASSGKVACFVCKSCKPLITFRLLCLHRCQASSGC